MSKQTVRVSKSLAKKIENVQDDLSALGLKITIRRRRRERRLNLPRAKAGVRIKYAARFIDSEGLRTMLMATLVWESGKAAVRNRSKLVKLLKDVFKPSEIVRLGLSDYVGDHQSKKSTH